MTIFHILFCRFVLVNSLIIFDLILNLTLVLLLLLLSMLPNFILGLLCLDLSTFHHQAMSNYLSFVVNSLWP